MDKEKQIEEMAKCCIYHKDGMCVIDKDVSYCDLMCKMFGFITNLYNAGYRKQSEWISVEERLPEDDTERVLVFVKENDFTRPIGINKIDTDRYVDGKWVRWREYVTHWMPLPEAPKMKGGE